MNLADRQRRRTSNLHAGGEVAPSCPCGFVHISPIAGVLWHQLLGPFHDEQQFSQAVSGQKGLFNSELRMSDG